VLYPRIVTYFVPAANTDITAGPSEPFVAYQAPCPRRITDLQALPHRAIRAVGLRPGNLASFGEPTDWKWGLKTRRFSSNTQCGFGLDWLGLLLVSEYEDQASGASHTSDLAGGSVPS
jgi:hypothetical protein